MAPIVMTLPVDTPLTPITNDVKSPIIIEMTTAHAKRCYLHYMKIIKTVGNKYHDAEHL